MAVMTAEQKQAAKDHGLELTNEQAFDEVVADACQRMLLDTNAGQRLAEFSAQSKQNQSIVQDIIQWIRDVLEKLRSIFADVDPDSLAAQEFAKFDANVKQILADMYVDMTIDAGENLSVIKNAFSSDTQVSKNDIRYTLPKMGDKKAPTTLTEQDLRDLLQKAKDKGMYDRTNFPVRINTPDVLLDAIREIAKKRGITNTAELQKLVADRPVAIQVFKARQALATEEDWDGDGKPHNLSFDDFVAIVKKRTIQSI